MSARSSRRSWSASRTSWKFRCSRYRNPPWISLLERLEVPDEKSARSTSATLSPRVAASSAMPAPVTPPPTTSRSKVASPSSASAEARSPGPSLDPGGLPIIPPGPRVLCRVRARGRRATWPATVGPPGSRSSKIAPPIVKPQAPAASRSRDLLERGDGAGGDHRAVDGVDHRARERDRVGGRVPVGEQVDPVDAVDRGQPAPRRRRSPRSSPSSTLGWPVDRCRGTGSSGRRSPRGSPRPCSALRAAEDPVDADVEAPPAASAARPRRLVETTSSITSMPASCAAAGDARAAPRAAGRRP